MFKKKKEQINQQKDRDKRIEKKKILSIF